ncbi:MAG: MBL fold metallo-hydrolase [Ruminococcaceae bacterium]|nr:MBL fold metallo-hydrolase [Oscillospiraceae bacterium]
MARFATLCSSSKGNSTYVGTAEHGILVDAGSNAKQLELSLAQLQLNPTKIDAIFVTHEHTDHVSGIRVFASRYEIPVYASPGTFKALTGMGILNGKFPAYEMTKDVCIGDIGVTAFRTSHDAKESTGYTIDLGERRVGICTDTGIMTNEILRHLQDCDLVLLESNHDPDMLEFGPYPLPLRNRIKSKWGHLSNSTCAETAVELLNNLRTRRFVLGHLSQENNTPDKAYICTKTAFDKLGAIENQDYTLCVAPEKCCEKYIIF